MTKRLLSKQKPYLQLGANIWGKAPFLWSGDKKDKWKNTPGEHRKKHRSLERLTPLIRGESVYDLVDAGYLTSKPNNKIKISYYEPKYASQLREKQKLRIFYGNVSEKQFRNYLIKAGNCKGKIGDNLIKLLEKRLDIIIYRAHFVNSVYQARQLINHGHVLVNGKVQNIASYNVNNGDIVQIGNSIQKALCTGFNWDILNKASGTVFRHASHLEVDYKTMACVYLYTPNIEEVYYGFNLDISKAIRHYV